ncbi:hypothetical protein PYCC9005_005137 [Savitreella phatthalungensis]
MLSSLPSTLLGLLAFTTFSAAGAPTAGSCDDGCKIAGARAYVQALATHDPSDVPFHPNCTRVEAGIQTGYSGVQLRRDLKYGPQYLVIRAVENDTYAVNGSGVVIADFGLDVGVGVNLARAHVHETFAYDDPANPGLMRRIVADIALTQFLGQQL